MSRASMASTATTTPSVAPSPPQASPTAVTNTLSSSPFLPSPFTTTHPPPTLITQGAEALLYRTHFLDLSTPAALKVRPSKSWRHPTLDARLTRSRVLAEARVLVKLTALRTQGVEVPAVLGVEWDVGRRVKGLGPEQRGLNGQKTGTDGAGGKYAGGAWLLMEWIEGKSVKDLLREWDVWIKSNKDTLTEEDVKTAEEDVKALLRRIGRAIGALHAKGGVVHGDLTTSNIMVRPSTPIGEDNENEIIPQGLRNGDATTTPAKPAHPLSLEGAVVLIDFGLATQSIQDEDRAVDLYVLERAFGSTHPRQEGWFAAEVLRSAEGYKGSFGGSAVVLKRLEEVRLRGRKRSMLG